MYLEGISNFQKVKINNQKAKTKVKFKRTIFNHQLKNLLFNSGLGSMHDSFFPNSL